MLHYQDQGKGEILVFLHGYLENKSMWNQLVLQLKSHYRCIAIDLPGHGGSKSHPIPESFEELATIIHEFLVAKQVDSFQCISHSMGGYLALAYLKQYPNHIKKLLLTHSTSKADSSARKSQRDRAIIAANKLKNAYIAHSIPHLFMPTQQEILANEIKGMIQEAQQMDTQSISTYLLLMKHRNDYSHWLAEQKTPVYYILGKHDPLLSENTMLQEINMTKKEAIFLENVGHMGHLEAASIFEQAVVSLLKK